ncbi:hypothetical protein D3C87_1553520 [compost metagenome]
MIADVSKWSGVQVDNRIIRPVFDLRWKIVSVLRICVSNHVGQDVHTRFDVAKATFNDPTAVVFAFRIDFLIVITWAENFSHFCRIAANLQNHHMDLRV